MNTFKKLVILLCLISGITVVDARVYDARSDNKFYSYLMKTSISVAMFYGQSGQCCKKGDMRKRYSCIEKLFSTIGKQGYYAKGGVTFIKANIKYDTVCDLLRNFYINEVPAFVLFKNGVDLRDRQGRTIVLVGWPTYSQLEDFIRDNLESDIDKNIKKRAKDLAKLREAERWSYLWYRPYFCGAWPYYGCGPGWGWGGCGPCRSGWGCGVGFGGCW